MNFVRRLAVLPLLLALASCGGNYYAGSDFQEGLSAGPPEAGKSGLPDMAQSKGQRRGPEPMGHIGYQPPIPIPIKFTVDTNFKVKVSVDRRLVTPLGTFTVGGSLVTRADDAEAKAPDPIDVTQLFICQENTGGRRCNGYEIRTGRKLEFVMDGRIEGMIEQNRIVIEAKPGTTIIVSDKGHPENMTARGPARIDIEEFRFSETGKQTEVDLEQSQSGTKSDLSYDHMTGELKPINGAKISNIKTYSALEPGMPQQRTDYPGESECHQTPRTDWKSEFSEDDLGRDLTVACIRTAEGDLGFVVVGPRWAKPTAYKVFTYTWAR